MSKASQNEKLLNALVDGELDAAKRDEALKLITDFPECARYVKQLKAQREQFRRLPRKWLSQGFADKVMAEAARRQIPVSATDGPVRSASARAADDSQPPKEFTLTSAGPDEGLPAYLVALGAMASLAALIFVSIYLGTGSDSADGSGPAVAKVSPSTSAPIALAQGPGTILNVPQDSNDGVSAPLAPQQPKSDAAEDLLTASMNRSGNGITAPATGDSSDDLSSGFQNAGAGASSGLSEPESPADGIAVAESDVATESGFSEVMIVQLDDRQQLRDVQAVFRENRIQSTFRPGAKPTAEGFEAVVVVASLKQVKQAISGLNDSAGITSYQYWTGDPLSYDESVPETSSDMIGPSNPEREANPGFALQLLPNVVLPRGQSEAIRNLETEKLLLNNASDILPDVPEDDAADAWLKVDQEERDRQKRLADGQFDAEPEGYEKRLPHEQFVLDEEQTRIFLMVFQFEEADADSPEQN